MSKVIVVIKMNDVAVAGIHEREIVKFKPKPSCTFDSLIKLESLLNTISEDFVSFSVEAYTEEE